MYSSLFSKDTQAHHAHDYRRGSHVAIKLWLFIFTSTSFLAAFCSASSIESTGSDAVITCRKDEARIVVKLIASKDAKGVGWSLEDRNGDEIIGQHGGYGKRTNPTPYVYSTCVSRSVCGGDGGDGKLTFSITGNGAFDSHTIFVDDVKALSATGHSVTSTTMRCSKSPFLLHSNITKQTRIQTKKSTSSLWSHSASRPPRTSSAAFPNFTSDRTFSVSRPHFSKNTRYDKKKKTPSFSSSVSSSDGNGPNELRKSRRLDTPDNYNRSDTTIQVHMYYNFDYHNDNYHDELHRYYGDYYKDYYHEYYDDWFGSMEWTLRDTEGVVVYSRSSKDGTLDVCWEKTCILDSSECYSLTYSGIFSNIDIRLGLDDQYLLAFEYKKGFLLGQGCIESMCEWKPALDPSSLKTKRNIEIMNKLIEISGREVFSRKDSPQYQAACWILYEDPLRKMAYDISLVQRYVIVTILISAKIYEEEFRPYFSSDDECNWWWWQENRRDPQGIICNYNNNKIEELNLHVE